jgi:transposase
MPLRLTDARDYPSEIRVEVRQQSLLDETFDAELAASELELDKLSTEPKPKVESNKQRRAPLPANLPRVDVHREPQSTIRGCGCQVKRIGEGVSEKLDYAR